MSRNDIVNVDGSLNYDKLGEISDQIAKLFKGSGVSAPTTGTWNVGDKYWNTAPVAGGYLGWVCVKSGTFGTSSVPVFKQFGSISV